MTKPIDTEKPISFATFLESVPPGEKRLISDIDVEERTTEGRILLVVNQPYLKLHCATERCGGDRTFACLDSSTYFSENPIMELKLFLFYLCRNCAESRKTYALQVQRAYDKKDVSVGSALKFGEVPGYGPPLSSRLLRMVGNDRELLLKGRRAENQGLGIGAFVYYRRVVENHRDQLFDQIRKAAEHLGADEDLLSSIDRAKAEKQFKKSFEPVKDAIPDGLKVKGHNPLTMLHNALSKGVHNLSDKECLERAQAVRVVLTELVANIVRITKDEREVDTSVSKLMSLD